MDNSETRHRIESLLAALTDLESPASDLGTPVLVEIRELDDVVALGLIAVPHLLSLLSNQPAKKVAYLVLILNRIGDRKALGHLRRLRSDYQALNPKDEWDFAVIGQCNLAIHVLEHQGG